MNDPTEVSVTALVRVHIAGRATSEQVSWLRSLCDEVIRHRDHPGPGTRRFMQVAHRAMRRLPKDVNPPERSLALRAIARFYYLQSEPELAQRAALGAVQAAAAGGHRELEAVARMSCANFLRDGGRFHAALQELERSLEIAKELPDRQLEAKILNSLGNWYADAGLSAEAMSLFERLAAFFESVGDALSTQMALDNAAIAAVKLGEYQYGLALSQRAAEVWAGEVDCADDKLWMVQGALPYCELLIQADRVDEALACARLATVVASGSEVAHARTLADVGLAIAGHAAGICGAEDVESVIDRSELDSPMTHVTALEAGIRALEHAGKSDLALTFQKRLFEFNRERKFEQVRRAIGCPSPEELQIASKLALLASVVDNKISDLTRIAIDQSSRAGTDDMRVFRIGRLAGLFANSLGLGASVAYTCALAGRFVDVGMMVVPDDLLRKSRPLTTGELSIVCRHAEFSAELLANTHLALLRPCVPIVRYHHERWDGGGPCALRGDAIPVGARLVSLCDVFDALCHRRPWRPAYTFEDTLRMIAERSGSQFDPELAASFVRWVDGLQRQVVDLDAYLGAEALDNDYVRMRDRIDRLLHGSA
jgi:response regulator RpfG family c-di-GMP phosphodiesterase